MSQYSSLTSVLLALFFFFELAFTASIRARAVYCCSNVSHVRFFDLHTRSFATADVRFCTRSHRPRRPSLQRQIPR